MQSNQFFLKKGPFSLKEIIKNINCTGDFLKKQDNKIYNIDSLVNAINYYLTNNGQYINHKKINNNLIKTSYNWESKSNNLLDIYKELLN